MNLLIIGTGSPIPPVGWGAVEAIIHEHVQRIPKFGHNVDLINTQDWWSLTERTKSNNKKYDFIHCHYDIMWPFLKALSCDYKVGMSSHFPYIGNEEVYDHFGYWKVMRYFQENLNNNYNFCISEKDKEYFISRGCEASRIFRMFVGAPETIVFKEKPKHADRTLYLGKICQRKRQEKYGHFDFIDFVGNISDEDINANTSNLSHYLGEWTKEEVHTKTTHYANLCLLSQGEDTPLVIREALIAGCGIVCSETSSEELDDLPFISIIPDEKLDDFDYIEHVIKENQKVSVGMRKEIRDYGVNKFGWDKCVEKYLNEVEKVVQNV